MTEKLRQKVNCTLPKAVVAAMIEEAEATGMSMNKLIGQTMWAAMQGRGRIPADQPYPPDGRGRFMQEIAQARREGKSYPIN